MPRLTKLAILLISLAFALRTDAQTMWKHLSTEDGSIPMPWQSVEQTGALVADLNNDGLEDFVLTCRKKAPAAIWYQRTSTGWIRHVIEDSMFTVEAGGVAWDIDGDGDLDLVFGGDWQNNQVWWWENPYPNINAGWTRHLIKNEGSTQHHDQVIGHFKHDSTAQLAFWNQTDKRLYIADIPANPGQSPWAYKSIFQADASDEKHGSYVEGMTKGDVDGDGYEDIIAGNCWFKYDAAGGSFRAIHYAEAAGRVAAGKFKPGKILQIVVSPGDGQGPARWYECTGNPEKEGDWTGHDLAGRNLIHGHSLQVADINADGNLDIFVAEMAKWSETKEVADNPNAEAFIFYGDGKGHFEKTVFQKGYEFHEARVADLDGDGDMDILSKPYNWKTPRIDIWLNNGTGKAAPSFSNIIPGKIGLELYSFRRELGKDLPGTLALIHQMGIKEVEGGGSYGLTPAAFKKLLAGNNLTMTSMLFDYALLRDSIATIIDKAKFMGVHYVGCGWIPHGGSFTVNDADNAIAVFNKAGEALKKAGIHFFYHAHGYEFAPYGDSTLFAYLAGGMKKGIADFELDVFWAYHGGAGPVLLMNKYKSRFLALHIKQMKAGQPTGIYTGNAPDESSVALPCGVIDFKQVLKTAMLTGVQKYYIEDEAVTAVPQVKRTLEYLDTWVK
ncbi:MAG TPA: hypothetical protein VHB48_09415 [Chitinophagaceae bacterium]|nr:hypothetical protein [Chitinophagaceae bacterium]